MSWGEKRMEVKTSLHQARPLPGEKKKKKKNLTKAGAEGLSRPWSGGEVSREEKKEKKEKEREEGRQSGVPVLVSRLG